MRSTAARRPAPHMPCPVLLSLDAAYAGAAVAGGYAPAPVPSAHSAVPGSSGGGGGGGPGSLHTVPSLGSSLGGMSLGGMASMPPPAPHVALSLTFFRNHAEQVGERAWPCGDLIITFARYARLVWEMGGCGIWEDCTVASCLETERLLACCVRRPSAPPAPRPAPAARPASTCPSAHTATPGMTP